MNERDDDLGRRVGEELGRRAEAVHRSSLSMDDVRGRATVIQRRRRVGIAVGALAAAAVLVPAAMLAAPALDRAVSPPPASQSPEPVPPTAGLDDPPPTRAVDSTAGVPVLSGDRVLLPDGSSLRPEVGHEPDELAVLADGRVVLAGSVGADRTVEVVSADGAPLASYPLSNGLAVAPEGAAVVWMDPSGTPMLLSADRDEPAALSTVAGGNPRVEVLRGKECADVGSAAGADCFAVVTVDGPDGTPGSWAADMESTERIGGPDAVVVTDIATDGGGRFSELVRIDDDGSCSAVYDPAADEYGPQTCAYGHLEFSPDGRHVLALDALVDGLGPRVVSVLETATLQPVDAATLTTEAVISDHTWEDDGHYLAVVLEQQGWHLLRVGLDGSREILIGPSTTADDIAPAYLLAELS